MTIPRDTIDEIRRKTDIATVVRRHVELKRAGQGRWVGLCPFHSEKSPSFNVVESEQGYFKCFGCGEGGDVFKFVQQIESLSFIEAVRQLAAAAGVELAEQSPADRRAQERDTSERERLRRAMSLAVEIYEAELRGPAGAAARAYLDSRGVTPELAATFHIGYAPPTGSVLREQFQRRQIPPVDAERLGLLRENERGAYDFFRDRIMLPVFDRQKRPVGFSGRLLDPEAKAAKYVNTQDSPLFHKKELLYGLHAAQEAIRRSGRAIVVEGNFDVISLHQAGFPETVAPMGTALTSEQVTLLGRLARQVIVLFDGDEAGLRASRKVMPLFVEAEVDGRVARLPRGIDPDDLVRDPELGGAEALRDLLATARPVVERFIDDVVSEAEPTIPGRVAAMEGAITLIAGVRNPTARELYAGRLATALGIDGAQVQRALRGALALRARGLSTGAQRRGPATGEGRGAPSEEGGHLDREGSAEEPSLPPPHEVELIALALVVGNPELASSPEVSRVAELLVHPATRRCLRLAVEPVARGEPLDVTEWMESVPENVRGQLWRLLIEGGFSKMPGADRALRDLVVKLEVMRIDGELAMVDRHLKDSLGRRDDQAVSSLNRRRLDLIAQKQKIFQSPARY